MIAPGACIGILGGGQLGRMMAIAARRFGYGVVGLDPNAEGPLAQVADRMWACSYDDVAAAQDMARHCDMVTVEFENVPAESLHALAELCPVAPKPSVLATTRHRLREKSFLRDHGFPVTRFAAASDRSAFIAAVAEMGTPVIAKTCEFGYDGKGQVRIDDPQAAAAAWESLGSGEVIIEAVVPFRSEASVICHRRSDGAASTFPVFANQHQRHILDLTSMPADLSPKLTEQARQMAWDITAALDVVGTLTVELFIVGEDSADPQILVNELAPRPHNSGHITIDACHTCQFEQHIRAICGLPLGDTSPLLGAGAMVNLLGDLWKDADPDWAAALAEDPHLKLHLYGKAVAAVGRKMGHINCPGAQLSDCVDAVQRARRALSR